MKTVLTLIILLLAVLVIFLYKKYKKCQCKVVILEKEKGCDIDGFAKRVIPLRRPAHKRFGKPIK